MLISRPAGLGLLLSAVLLSHGVLAADLPRARPAEVGFSAERLEYIDQFYSDKVEKGELAGAVTLVARHGKIVHFSAVGFADLEKKRKMAKDTVFRAYSMTKPVSSTALMLLYEEGRFRMSDPLSKYIPEFANLKVLRTPDGALDDVVPMERPPTVQDAFRHTIGFTHGLGTDAYEDLYNKAEVFGLEVTLEQMMTKLSKIPLKYQPGTKYSYGVGPDVGARLVEVLSGMPYDEFLEKRLFKPLGMKDAGFWVPPEKAKRLATVHWEKNGKLTPLDEAHGHPDGGILVQPWSVNSYTVNHKQKRGSIGIVATAEDYWRFAQMLLNGGQLDSVRVLSPYTVNFATRDQLKGIGVQLGNQVGVSYGLGFSITEDPAAAGAMGSEGTFGHGGAAATNFLVDPKEDMVMVIMTQHLGAPTAGAHANKFPILVYSALLE